MRTVSFSDSKVRNLFNNRFVNTFTNTQGDPTAGQSIKHRPNESPGPCIRGNGKQNVQTIFMTPQCEIFHVATGYQSADDLLTESEFALNLFDKIKSASKLEKSQQVVNAHQQRLGKSVPSTREPLGEFNGLVSRLMPGQGSFRPGSQTRNPLLGQSNFRPGSQTRNGLPGQNVLGQFTQMGVDDDQRFSIQHPLMTYRELERDPTKLVGSGSSFFASSGGGTDLFK